VNTAMRKLKIWYHFMLDKKVW